MTLYRIDKKAGVVKATAEDKKRLSTKVHPLDRLLVIKKLAKKYNKPPSKPHGWDNRHLKYKLTFEVGGQVEQMREFDDRIVAAAFVKSIDSGQYEGGQFILTERYNNRQLIYDNGVWRKA
jgi:hypothetical protein